MSIPHLSRLGPYEILAPLGAGGMGEVYRARDPRLGREVAIKVLPAHRLSDETKRRRFVQEARTASTLNHPSIVTIHEIERDGDVDFIVMELVHGKDLERSIPPRGMPLAEALRIAIPVADALARAHAAGIVHRDLKPANVVVSDEGVPKILDFGLAKLLESEAAGSIESTLESPLSHAGTIAGTPGYMSPEQATGRSVDARSDVFSFGALLFEMVTGRRAFAGTTVPEALAATLSADPGPPSKLAQGVTEPLDRLILRCLRKDPDRRFQHMSDVKVELQEIAEEVAAGGSQGSLARVAAAGAVPPAARRRVWWWVAAAAAALLAAGAAAWLIERSRWRNPLAGAQFTRITDFDGTELDGAISRDGKFVAFLAARDGPLDTWVSQIGTGSFHNLTEGRAPGLVDEEVRNLGFSPDGALVYVWVRTAAAPGKQPINVWAVPTLGGPLRPFLEAAEVAWSPDGKQLVYHPASDGDPLHVSERDAGAGRRIYAAPSGVHCHYPTWSPDGAFIYFVRGFAPDQMDVWRIRPAGGEIDRLTFHEARVSHPNLLDDRTLVYIAPAEDGSGPSLYGMDVDERTPHRISFGIERYTSIAASADGRRLVATLSAPEASLWRLAISDRAIDASGPTRLPVRALSPRLGSGYLVYLKDDGKAIWKLEGDRASELWTGDGRVPAPPAVSPNGERIAFTMRRGEHTRLYAMNADGTGVRPLIEALEVRGGIAWSPDSEAIVVGVDQGNGPQLWHIPLADAAPRAVTTEYSIDPVWSPDGGSLVYSGSQLGPGYALKAITPGRSPGADTAPEPPAQRSVPIPARRRRLGPAEEGRRSQQLLAFRSRDGKRAPAHGLRPRVFHPGLRRFPRREGDRLRPAEAGVGHRLDRSAAALKLRAEPGAPRASSNQPAQSGLRFSRKAVSPSRPSAEARRSAIASIVSSRKPLGARGDAADQRLRRRDRARGRLEQLGHALVDGRVELVEGDHAVDEAERLGARGAEALPGQEQLARGGDADLAHDVRRDHAGHQAQPHLAEREAGAVLGHHDVRDRGEPGAASECRPLHAGDDGMWRLRRSSRTGQRARRRPPGCPCARSPRPFSSSRRRRPRRIRARGRPARSHGCPRVPRQRRSPGAARAPSARRWRCAPRAGPARCARPARRGSARHAAPASRGSMPRPAARQPLAGFELRPVLQQQASQHGAVAAPLVRAIAAHRKGCRL